MSGVAAAGSLPASAAIEWLRNEGPSGESILLQLDPDPTTQVFSPLQELTISSKQAGSIRVFDGQNQQYLKQDVAERVSFTLGGALGNQLVILQDKKGKALDFATFRVDCRTEVNDSSGKYHKLLDVLYYTMTNEWEREVDVVHYNGKYYHHFVRWIRDHVHTLKGMKYFYPELKTGIDLYADSQREDGMIWDNYNKRPPEGDYWEQRFDYGDFVRVVDEGKQEFRRIPVENDVEYLFLEGIYFTWKASGDHEWMKKMLDPALKAVAYSTSDPYRWSKKYNLLKRGYTIDTWDFQNDEDAEISTGPDNYGDPMVIKLPYTRFGIMFGDNTGMAVGCSFLAEMLEFAGRTKDANLIRKTGEGIRDRLNDLSWNGKFFTHHVPEDTGIKRDLGVDEKSQVSLSNAYSINRQLKADQVEAIIRTYMELRENMPASSAGEWYTIYPPFGRGYGGHNTQWSYMNGGVTSIVAGELAHGAFEHGFETYGIDILDRLLDLSEKTGGFLHCTYRGAMEDAPERSFTPLPLQAIANTDTHGITVEGVAGWTGEGENDLHEFPSGKQVFENIPFEIIDPATHGRKACLGLSGDALYADEAELDVNEKAASIYFLHIANNPYYAGNITLQYEDGSSHVDHIGPGKISGWWYPSAPQDRKQTPAMRVAWRGKNYMSRNVGVCLYGLNNPYKEKIIKSILFTSAGDSTKWMVMGVTLSDHARFFMPDMISAGIPDNWGAAAVVYALVEGLCGVKDRGVAYNKLTLSPRWSVAAENEAAVTIKYPASGGYVSYKYSLDDNSIGFTFTGTLEDIRLEILLPVGKIVQRVIINGREIDFSVLEKTSSSYLVVDHITDVVGRVKIELS